MSDETPPPDGPQTLEEIADAAAWAVDQAAQIAQARALRDQAGTSGLTFEAYLVPGLAEWVLDRVIAGRFRDPAEAVFAIFRLYQDLEPHPDLLAEIENRATDAAMQQVAANPGSARPLADVLKRIEEDERRRAGIPPATWQRIPMP